MATLTYPWVELVKCKIRININIEKISYYPDLQQILSSNGRLDRDQDAVRFYLSEILLRPQTRKYSDRQDGPRQDGGLWIFPLAGKGHELVGLWHFFLRGQSLLHSNI